MPLNIGRLANNMELLIKTSIMSRHPEAKPGKHLKKFCFGVATGFVSNMVGAKGRIAKAGGLGAPTTGVRGMDPNRLAETMRLACKLAFGSEGPELITFTTGIAQAIVLEMGLATVMGTDAGVAQGFKGGSAPAMAKAMFRATGFKPTKQNQKFFKAISESVIEEINKYGKTSVPSSGPGSASATAILA